MPTFLTEDDARGYARTYKLPDRIDCNGDIVDTVQRRGMVWVVEECGEKNIVAENVPDTTTITREEAIARHLDYMEYIPAEPEPEAKPESKVKDADADA